MRTENSVTRVTVWHHEACSKSEWQNFQFAPKNHYGFFFLHTFPSTTAFKLEYALFYQFFSKLTVFFIKKCSVQLLSKTLTSKHLMENDVKNWSHDVKNWCLDIKKRPDIMHQSRLTPPHVRQHFLAQVGFTEIPDWYARSCFMWHQIWVYTSCPNPIHGSSHKCIKA